VQYIANNVKKDYDFNIPFAFNSGKRQLGKNDPHRLHTMADRTWLGMIGCGKKQGKSLMLCISNIIITNDDWNETDQESRAPGKTESTDFDIRLSSL